MTTAETNNLIKPAEVGEPLERGRIIVAGLTTGKAGRVDNQDGYTVTSPKAGYCAILGTDGVSSDDGYNATLLANQRFSAFSGNGSPLRPNFVDDALFDINQQLANVNRARAAEVKKLRATAVVGVIRGERDELDRSKQVVVLRCANVGDSGILLLRDNGLLGGGVSIRYLTRYDTHLFRQFGDQEAVAIQQRMFDTDLSAERIPADLAMYAYNPASHAINYALGNGELPRHNYNRVVLKNGDVVMFASDGVLGAIHSKDLKRIYKNAGGDLPKFHQSLFFFIDDQRERGMERGVTTDKNARLIFDDKFIVSAKIVI